MGQSPIEAYNSSNERPIKESKLSDDDPFGLDPIIKGMDCNIVKSRGHKEFTTFNSFDCLRDEHTDSVNSVGGIASDGDPGEEHNEAGLPEHDILEPTKVEVHDTDSTEDVTVREKEVEDTIAFGNKIGAQLGEFQDLVRGTIMGEGVQTGLK